MIRSDSIICAPLWQAEGGIKHRRTSPLGTQGVGERFLRNQRKGEGNHIEQVKHESYHYPYINIASYVFRPEKDNTFVKGKTISVVLYYLCY